MSYLIKVFVNMCLVTFHFWICAFGPFGFGVFGNGCFDLGSLVWVVGFGILGSGSLSIEAFVWISRLDLLDISFGSVVWIPRSDLPIRSYVWILRSDLSFGSFVLIFRLGFSLDLSLGCFVWIFGLRVWGWRSRAPESAGWWQCWRQRWLVQPVRHIKQLRKEM